MSSVSANGQSITDIERQVIGNLITYFGDLWIRRGTLDADCFDDLRNRTIWAAIVEMDSRGESVDLPLLSHELTATGKIESAGGVSYLAECASEAVSKANFDHHVRTLIHNNARKQWIGEAYKIDQLAHDPSATIAEINTLAQEALFKKINGRHVEKGVVSNARISQQAVVEIKAV